MERAGMIRMPHSFAGMDAPGDTQPDSQMHRDWTSGILGTGDASMLDRPNEAKSLFAEHADEDDGDTPSDAIDFVESSQADHSPTVTSPTVIHDHSPALPKDGYALTSPLKFETPAVAGKKRDISGQVLSSAVRTDTTPGTVISTAAFPGFGNGAGAVMSLTQAWQNTQAPTSPAVAGLADDVVFTRPSPNFTQARHSSPIPVLSSPIKAGRTETARTDPIVRSSSEPRAEYVSMKQSQERRKRMSRDQPVPLFQEDSWEELSAAQVRAQKKKMRENLERSAAKSFAHVSAPTSELPEAARRRLASAKNTSPVKSATSRQAAQPSVVDSGFGNELAHASAVGDHNDDGSPDELSQNVPSTAQTLVKHNSRDNKVQVPKTSSHPHRTQSGKSRTSTPITSASSQLRRETQLQASAQITFEDQQPHSSKESVAVMDSQPLKSLRFPSSPSQNQYSINQTTMAAKTGYTSQVVSSSMPPMPPSPTQQEEINAPVEDITPEETEGVPSSPPLITLEGDLTYDEHEQEPAYNEYDEEQVGRASTELFAADGEDMIMEDDEDLPISKPELDEDGASATTNENTYDDELDLIQPLKVDLGTDQEVPETLEQDESQQNLPEDDEEPHGRHELIDAQVTLQPARVQRQNTIPDTDALEDTQPSFFPNNYSNMCDEALAEPVIENDAPSPANATEPFSTAQEQVSESHFVNPVPASLKEDGSDTIQTGERIRSLQDIFNLPDTQQSTVEEEIEMPRLSGLDESEDNTFMPGTSSAPRSAKRRKVTYASKRNVFRSPTKQTTTEQQQLDKPLETSPPKASASELEQRGALAVTRVRDDAQAPYTRPATLKSKAMPKPSKPQVPKKGGLRSVSKALLQSTSSPLTSPAKSRNGTTSRTHTPVTPSRRGRVHLNIDMPDVDEERDELADPTPEPVVQESVDVPPIIKDASDRGETPTGDINVPNRVFAAWPGSHYYPATCQGRVAGRHLRIRFDDNNVTTLDASHVRALDLRPGDHVKVDEPGMKRHTYIVIGFKDKLDVLAGEEFPATDRRGYATIVLEEKQRDSLPVATVVESPDHISVPLGSVYLTTQLWTRLRDRTYNFSPLASPSKTASRIGTPVAAMDALDTPSFTRRGTALASLLKDATGRAASVASTSTRSGSGSFSNMAFVLTSTAADVDKEAIAKLIKTNGGQVLEHGFHELFDYEPADVPSSSQSRRRSASVVDSFAGLTIKPQFRDLGFVALLSDAHSRSTKYIQALALNVPCLHLRWVQDSLAAARAAPFAKYLLPAGVSKFLDPNGVVRSRLMTVYDPSSEDVSLANMLNERDLLLQDQTVLLVTGKSKKELEKRQPFIFLTHALGSANVGRCADLPAVAQLLQKEAWDWVYVDNGEQGVADAAAELFGTGSTTKGPKKKGGKKRKRDETEDREELVARGEVGGKRVKVTCSEFVIQSLILGALVEE
jgi:hypothetical protein